ncbi:DNA polymerase Y family protein [Methylorubrum suomiense]|nr:MULTISPECIES: DNA polymerase Y family protein [Methylobacteriaceae]
MRRVVSLCLPSWPTDRLRRSAPPCDAPAVDEPLATVRQDGPRRVLAGIDATARRHGLRPGMAAAQAMAMVPGLRLVPAEPEADAAGLVRLGIWCLRYAPLVALDPPDGILIDVAGAAHLQGGEANLLADLAARLERTGMSACLALADTPGAAWAVARFGPGGIVPPGGTSVALLDLPVAALRLPPEIVAALAEVGILRIGGLMAAPRAPLRRRFGPEPLLRLDRATGAEPEPLAILAAPEAPRAALRFPDPVGSPEVLGRVVGDLCTRIVPDLERMGLGARRLDLVFRRIDRLDQAIRIGTARPSRDAAHLARLLTERLPQIDPGFGIEEMTLTASRVEALAERQLSGAVLGGEPEAVDLAALVDTLRLRLGAERIYRLAPVESDWPERAVRRVPALAAPLGALWPADLPRPARLLAAPEPVAAMAEIPDAPPLFFVWRGARHKITRADGPERILGEWWIADGEAERMRDYYRVETEAGERFWLFRDGPMEANGRWWLHGLGEA